jgi:hypothetical protein
MPKSAKKHSPKSAAERATTAKPPNPAITDPEKKSDAGSKQARLIEMLQSPTGITIAAMMEETGWQQHSVRGFLAGVVRKKLKLKLNSKKIDGSRVYRVDGRLIRGPSSWNKTSEMHGPRGHMTTSWSRGAGPRGTIVRDRIEFRNPLFGEALVPQNGKPRRSGAEALLVDDGVREDVLFPS